METEKKRHSAVRPKHGKPSLELKPTPKRLALADLLQHGPLPSNYIKKWLGTPQYVEDLLKELDEAHWIGMPKEAKVYNVLSRPFVYELLHIGRRELKNAGREHKRDHSGDTFKHQFLAATTRYSFHMAPREIAGLKLVTQADILANPKCPARTRDEAYPAHVPLERSTIKPDADIFGFEYTAPAGTKAYMFFHGFEIDRGTEQSKESPKRKTLEGMLRNYARYLEDRIYYTRYGLSQVSIPILTTKPGRKANMMEFVRTNFTPSIQKRFIFKELPDFTDRFLDPTAHMVATPWDRVGATPLHIIETLKATAESKANDTGRETPPRGGAHSAEA